MKPIGDTGKNQKAVQGFIGPGKSAAKASLRLHSETQKAIMITLYRGISF